MISPVKRFFVTYKRILSLAYSINPKLLILITLTNSFWGLTNLPVLYINKILIDLVIANIGNPNWQQVSKTIISIILLRSAIELTRSVLSRINGGLSNYFSSNLNVQIDLILGSKLNKLDIPTIEDSAFQDRYKKVSRESRSRLWNVVTTLSDFPNSVFTIISGLIPLFSFSPLICIIVFILNLPEAIYNGKLAKLDYQDRDKMNKDYRLQGWINWIITDTSQLSESKLYNTFDYMKQKITGIQNKILQMEENLRKRRIKWRTLSDLPQTFFSVYLNSYFFILALSGKISLGFAQMLYQSANTLSNGFGMLSNNIANVYENYLTLEDFTWFMDLKSKSNQKGELFPNKLSTGVVFNNVWFRYPKSTKWILKGVSFVISPTENIALVGENGVGKTTILKLLLGFYQPNKGKITVNSLPISEYNQGSFWNKIASLQQDFHLFPFSARESISYSDFSQVNNLEKIKQAASLSDIDQYIQGLPKKYDNPITNELDGGVEPSGGQRQRFGLARALFKKSLILILDEPTSNVDPKAEEEIFENIIRVTQNQILILVSHRFSTVRRADKILVMDGGQIVETGSHDELMGLNGLYAKLFTLQAKSYQ